MVNAALDGQLDDVATWHDPVFGIEVPETCPGVPPEVLRPRETWHDKAAYDSQARKLAHMFHENFSKFAQEVSENIRSAGPEIG
jgi:phosphoenolpyruvate carboxykinase (ATP)